MERPAWIAFDLNGTLLDPAGPLDDQHADLAQAALDDAVLQAMADTLTGEHRPFPEHLRAALERRLLVAGLGDAVLDAAMERARALPAFHDAAVALEILASGGYRIAVVTNSAADAGRTALAAAGLNGHIEAVVGADEAGAYKPDPRVYGLAAARLGAAPDGICLVAAHAWDVLGAQRAGWRAAWVAHRERHLLSTVPEPLVRAASLEEAARQLTLL
jgi:2-haloacid dehalogenase